MANVGDAISASAYSSGGTCPSCGSYFIGGHACNVVDYGQALRQNPQWSWGTTTTTPWLQQPQRQCTGHCFCIEMTPVRSLKVHLECCKCSDRKLKT